MERYNHDTDDELTNLRGEMEELRRMLDTQQIVTDKLLRNVMKEKTEWTRRFVSMETFVLLPFSLLFIIVALVGAIGWPFAIVTVVMCTADVLVDRRINNLQPSDYASMPLLDLKEQFIRRKMLRRKSLIISLAVLVPWFAWFMYEMSMREHPFYKGALMGGIIGAIAGVCLGYNVYRKMQRADDSVLMQISEMRQAED